MSDYITIHSGLLRAVANELLHAASGALLDTAPGSESFTEVPASLVEGLRQYMADGDSDDHSVGLCTCDTNALAYELGLTLNGEMTCPDCNGDGFNYDAEQAKRDIADGAAKYGLSLGEAESLLCFDAGMTNCESCNGKGVAQISDFS